MTSPHFAWLPPEINSALIFAGPGAAPLLAAAAAWDGLAEELASSASSFSSVTSDLANGSWQGASAAAMMAVATQYVSWLSAAAAQAESASSQAAAIAGAFETALAATVQPAVVAANRGLVRALAATNWFGFNLPAIMDTEAAYEQMWAADVAAMFGYHVDASTATAQLAPWRQVLHNLGINFSKGHQLSGAPVGSGTGSTSGTGSKSGIGSKSGTGSKSGIGSMSGIGSGTGSGTASGSATSSTAAVGSTGTPTSGSGNAGTGNVGLGNTGSNNIGFGNTGNNGFNSGTGNVGLFNSGTNNVGLFNSGTGNFGIANTGVSNTGIANAGSLNTGLFNTGTANTGFFQDNLAGGAASGALNSASYVTGGVGANLGSGLLSSITGPAGGLGAGLPSQGLVNPASAVYNGSTDAGSMSGGVGSSGANAGVTASGGPTPIPPALRTTTSGPLGFLPAAGSNDSGFRNLPTRESGIPNSSFFNRGDPNPEDPNLGIGVPDPTE